MIPATVLLGSMAAGGLGLYLSGSTGPSTEIATPVEQPIADEVSRPIQFVSPQEETEVPQKVPEPVPEAEPEAEEEPVPESPVSEPVPEPEVAKPVPVAEAEPVAEPVPEPEVAKPVPEVTESPEEEPTAVQGGQRGGFGRPTWAPLNSRVSLAQALGITPGTPAGNALATATGSKTPQQIQLELVAIDEQIRALNASTFSLTQEEKDAESVLAASRTDLQNLEDEIFRNEKLLTFLTGKINSTSNIQETNVKLTKIVVDEVTPIFSGPPDNLQLGGKKKGKPGKPGGTGAFTPTENQKLWLVKALRYYRNLPDEDRDEDIPDLFRVENKKDLDREASGSNKIPNYTSDDTLKSSDAFDLTKVPTDDAEKVLALKWWNFLRGKVHQEEIDPTKVQAELTGFMNEKRKYDNLVRESQYKLPDAKEKTKEKELQIQEIRTKLSENKKKKKELEASRELLLKELSAYKVPQSFFDKKDAKLSVLPKGEDLNRLLIEFRQIEDDIARNERERNDYVSIQLASNPSWTGDARYEELNKAKEELKKKKSNKIAEIEGRTPSQIEQLKENPFQFFVRELTRDKLTKRAGETLLKTSFPEVFKMYYELSKSSADKIYEQVDKYYNFFKKGVSSSINLSSFNGQDVSRALAFFFALTKEQGLSPELKEKVTQFSQENKQIIANALVNLELALQQIKTPTTEERSIVEQALMSGESVPWKTIKRAAVSLDVSSLFTKTVEQKLIILKDSFRERIYDKLKDVSVKYGLWGKTEIQGYRQTIEGSFNEYKKLMLDEIVTFNAIPDTDRQKIEKQNQSMTKIRGLARLMMTLLQEGDRIRNLLTRILDSPEFKGGAKLTPDEFKATLEQIKNSLEKGTDTRLFVLDGKQALFDQLVQAKAMIIKKNTALSFAIGKKQSVDKKLALAKELLTAYSDLVTIFQTLIKEQTTTLQKRKLGDDIATYIESRNFLRKKIEQTEFDIEKKPPTDSTWETIVKLSAKTASLLGSVLTSLGTVLSSIPNLGITTALGSVGVFFSNIIYGKPIDPNLSKKCDAALDQFVRRGTPPTWKEYFDIWDDKTSGITRDELDKCMRDRGIDIPEEPLAAAVLSVDSFDTNGVILSWTGVGSASNTIILTDKSTGTSVKSVAPSKLTTNKFIVKQILKEDTEYTVQLESQTGTQKVTSNIVEFKTAKTPVAPLNLMLEDMTENSITVSWVGGNGGVITSEVNGTLDATPITSPHTFTGLTPETDYSIVIIATKGSDVVRSNTLAVKTLGTAGPTPIVAKLESVTDTTAIVSWNGGDGAIITSEVNGVPNVDPITSPHTFTGLTPETDYSFVIIGTSGTTVVKSNPVNTKTLEKANLKEIFQFLYAAEINKEKYKPTFDTADSFVNFLIALVTTKVERGNPIPAIFPSTITSYNKGVQLYRKLLNPSLFAPQFQYIVNSISGKYNTILNDVFRESNNASTSYNDETQKILSNYVDPVCKFKEDDDVIIVSITRLVKDALTGAYVERKQVLAKQLVGKIVETVFYSRDNHTSAPELCTQGKQPFYKVKYTDETGKSVTNFLSESDLILKSSPAPGAGSDPDIKNLKTPDLFIKEYVAKNSIKLLDEPQYVNADASYNLSAFYPLNADGLFQKWRVIKTNGDGNCLTHAFLQSLSPEYGKIEDTANKNKVAIAFRLEFAKTPLARNKALYNQSGGTEWLTHEEISDYSNLFNLVTIVFDQPNQERGGPGIQSITLLKKPEIKDDTKIIFIHASGAHYSSIMDDHNNFTQDYIFAKEIGGLIGPLNDIPVGGGNHTTRRQRVRGMPSRLKTRRTY
jgi:hypothetical protein